MVTAYKIFAIVVVLLPNGLSALRRRFPEFVFPGWFDEETLNEGNETLIRSERASKALLPER